MKVKINCAPPPEIKWFKGDTDITKSGGYKITRDPNGFDTLIIGSASRSSAGEYEVKATNEMGTASSRCTIKVNSKYLVFAFCVTVYLLSTRLAIWSRGSYASSIKYLSSDFCTFLVMNKV